MNIRQLSSKSHNFYLYEGLDTSEKHSVMLWESAGLAIKEAALTADQIQQLFTSIEQGATAGGSNRTLLGKGKDVAGAVKTAYDDLVSKVQNSGPIKNIDAKYDQAAEKLKQATGGDQGVMKYVEKYRKFAKERPIAQGLIYAALIAAAGISGVGIGGAAALGLLKMTDKLLQGEKFSTAVGKGVATGALAYGAGQIGQALKGGDQVAQAADTTQQAASGFGRLTADTFKNNEYWGPHLEKIMSNPSVTDAYKSELMKQLSQSVGNAADPSSMSKAWIKASRVAKLVAGNPLPLESVQHSKKLSEGQVYLVFNRVCAQQLDEGVFDKIKTFGKNLTTKVTADKLNSAWQKAGAPMDSNELSAFLKTQGVGDDVIASTYAALKIPTASTAASSEKSAKIGLAQINKILPTLRTRDLLSIQQVLQKTMAGKKTAAA